MWRRARVNGRLVICCPSTLPASVAHSHTLPARLFILTVSIAYIAPRACSEESNSAIIMTTNGSSTVNPSEVGWQFVPQYYTFVNKQPNRLHCFYTKASTFVHGLEGEDTKPCYGQQVCAPS